MIFQQVLQIFASGQLLVVFISVLMVTTVSSQIPKESKFIVDKCWDYPISQSVITTASDTENIYAAFDTGTVKSIGLRDGRDRWTADLGGKVSSNIANLTDRILVVTSFIETSGSESSTLRVLSKQTGVTLFSAKLTVSKTTYLIVGTETVVAIGSSGSVIGLTKDGKPQWNFALSSEVSTEPMLSITGISIPLVDKSIQKIGFRNGETISKQRVSTIPTAIAGDADGHFFIGDNSGRLYKIDIVSGRIIWIFKIGGRVEHLVINGERLYVASVDNFVYSISTHKGSVVWKKRMSARIDGRPLIWASNLVVSTFGESSANILDANNGKSLKTIEFGLDNIKITAATLNPDGTLIFPLKQTLTAFRFGGCVK